MGYSTAPARIQPRAVCMLIMPTTQPSSRRQQLLEQPLLLRVKPIILDFVIPFGINPTWGIPEEVVSRLAARRAEVRLVGTGRTDADDMTGCVKGGGSRL